MTIKLTPKFPREGAEIEIPAKTVKEVYDGYVKTIDGKYIAVRETKEEIIKLLEG